MKTEKATCVFELQNRAREESKFNVNNIDSAFGELSFTMESTGLVESICKFYENDLSAFAFKVINSDAKLNEPQS